MNMRERFKRLRVERESGALPQADATRVLDERVDSALSDHVGPVPPPARARVSQDLADVPAEAIAAAAADPDTSAPGVEKKTPFSEKKDDEELTVRPALGPSSSGLSIALAGTESANSGSSGSSSRGDVSPLKALANKVPSTTHDVVQQTRSISHSAPASPNAAVDANIHNESSFASLIKSFNDFRHRTFAATSKDKRKEGNASSRKRSDPRPRLKSGASNRSNTKRDSASHSSSSNGHSSDGFMSGFTGSGATRARQKSDSAAVEKSQKQHVNGKKRDSAPAQVHATPVTVGCMQPRPRSTPSPDKKPQQVSLEADKDSSRRAKGSAKKSSARSQVSRDEKPKHTGVRSAGGGGSGSTGSHLSSLDFQLHRETMAQAALATGQTSFSPMISPHAHGLTTASH